MPAISRVRHTDEYGCVMLCIDKERQGFECVKPITYVSTHQKYFNKRGQFLATEEDGYYEAIYRKEVM